MIFITQDGKKAYAGDQLAMGRTEFDETTQAWEVGWLIADENKDSEDFDYAPMGWYATEEDAQLVERQRVWAEYTMKLPTFRYPPADVIAELRESLTELFLHGR